MPFAHFTELLKDAQKGKYAVGAFNIFNIENLHSIVEVAEEEKSPVILQINPIHFHHTAVSAFLHYVKEVVHWSKVPIALHLDHAKDLKTIMNAIKYGFPSIMYDGSHLPYEENISRTKQMVDLCHPIDITVEAELGKLIDNAQEITEDNRKQFFTDPEDANEFVAVTQIDALALSIGNAHGFYNGEPNLDFARLKTIRKKTDAPLVLHGGSGIPNADIKKAISLGICKINIYTEMGANVDTRLRKIYSERNESLDMSFVFGEIREGIKAVVREKIRLFGSAGKGA